MPEHRNLASLGHFYAKKMAIRLFFVSLQHKIRNMEKIKNIAFDFGGVVLALSYEQAVSRFEEIGLANARQHLDAFQQKGIFGALEEGCITAEEFRQQLSLMVGRTLTMDECYYAWQGYLEYVPQKNIETILQLRQNGYKVCLLSNTNPFMMQWANADFDGKGNGVSHYFDALYLSYQLKVMKPHREIFEIMLRGQQATAAETIFIDDSTSNCAAAEAMGIRTLCPQNNADWTAPLLQMLG